MFDYIKGIVKGIGSNYIVIENNNIGFIIYTASPYSFKENEQLCIYTHSHIREDAFDLYGFKTLEERNIFVKLISVKGIGPKGALAILANGDINGLQAAIDSGDVKYLQKFPGIGPKASGQIILDLKNDSALRAEMGSKGYNYLVENFHPKDISMRYLNSIKNITKENCANGKEYFKKIKKLSFV